LMRRLTFQFTSVGTPTATAFNCALMRQSRSSPYTPCTSPRSYGDPEPGNYRFRVRAVAAGQAGAPTTGNLWVPVEFSRCWGAASRDPTHPCPHAFERRVVPHPQGAMLVRDGYCDNWYLAPPGVCSFGVEGAQAAGAVALVGDSHAGALRRALQYVAEVRDWHGYSFEHDGCGFSAAYMSGVAALTSQDCHTWGQQVIAWLDQHPEVGTVVITGADYEQYATSAEQGFHDAWQALSASVHRIDIIRDNPHAGPRARGCLYAAIARHAAAGLRCAQPRSAVLRPDAEAAAALSSPSSRVHLIDLTRFFCSPRLCFPVVGGALVLADYTHITQEFSQTLGPYLLRAMT
jgi:SGNH domain (fused to AT3 domains)